MHQMHHITSRRGLFLSENLTNYAQQANNKKTTGYQYITTKQRNMHENRIFRTKVRARFKFSILAVL